MKPIYLLLAITCLFSFDAQAQKEFAQPSFQQIQEQVWMPFKQAYDSRDAATYNALHSDDVLRITEYGLKKGAEHKNAITQNFAKKSNSKSSISFVFEHHLVNGETAYQVGYYRVITENKDGTKRKDYGRFHVVLKQLEGAWKIAQDWDTSNINGHVVTKEDFERLEN